ncbi:unnamed protein product [Penicillium glandicola]
MPPQETMTAAQRALGIAEIVGQIISFVPPEWAYKSLGKYLGGCALVNQLWLAETLPIVWSTVSEPIQDMFEVVKPDRRQYYAQFVVTSCAGVWNDAWRFGDHSENLKGLVFPRLTSLHMLVSGYDGECSLPELNCPNLRYMILQDLDPSNKLGHDGMCPDEWESIFWDLPIKYPHVPDISFAYPPRVFPNAVRRLKKWHPNLRDCLKTLQIREVIMFANRDYHLSDGGGFHSYSDESDMEDLVLEENDLEYEEYKNIETPKWNPETSLRRARRFTKVYR